MAYDFTSEISFENHDPKSSLVGPQTQNFYFRSPLSLIFTLFKKGCSISLMSPSLDQWNIADPEVWEDIMVKSILSDPRQPVIATHDSGSLLR